MSAHYRDQQAVLRTAQRHVNDAMLAISEIESACAHYRRGIDEDRALLQRAQLSVASIRSSIGLPQVSANAAADR